MIEVHSFSEVGGHRENEDALCVQAHPLDADCWLCFVADGQGGRPGGGPAARLACEAALAAALNFPPDRLIEPSVWLGLLRLADAAVVADPLAGFTTFVGLCIYRDLVVAASSGDSAAILVCDNKIVELTSQQHKNPPIGSGAAIAVPFVASLESPWRVLVMSDGVWKYIGWDRVAANAKRSSGPEVIDELKRLARLPGSQQFQDDFTIVILNAGSEAR